MIRKFKLLLRNNKILLIIVSIVLILIVLSIWGLSKLESFYRIMTIAMLPVNLLVSFTNAAAFVFMYVLFSRSGFEKLKKNKIKAGDIAVSFKEVIGLESAKREAFEVVQLIKDRKQLQKIGGKIIKGILLIGPPGCGKTLLAKAIATECKVPFLSMAGSEFVEVFVGVGASRVRNLFKKAREYAYAEGACIIFIDEIEVIGRGRSFSYMGGGEEINSTQNQLLVEMDGLDNKKSNVIVIAATNADDSVLDKALLRPGRFDRKIAITLPNLKERERLFGFYLKKVKVVPEVKVCRLAKKAVYKSPADIENIIKEAALIAVRKKKEVIDIKDLSEAMDRIDLGMETYIDMTPKELGMTAYHEAGHAVAIYLMHPTDDVFKVTVKSHHGSLGLVAPFPKEELQIEQREELLSDIMVSLAGYVAEKIKYNTTTTGVSMDFSHAMTTANNMVWKVGMGNGGFVGDFSVIPRKEMSQSLKEKLNNETISIINSCYAKIEEFLKTNWDAVDAVAKKLISEKELDFDELEEVMKTVGKRKPKPSEYNALVGCAE
ncbi:AAA family ATPase [Candidatus Endomicrobiellum trichonymphae]|uniref:Metallo-protease FtsH n=1 Tax=Endomicrobium trichonymphae TaxID=1408204 RepID=B1GZZ2_ENDTX|nr:AAA family ATPase [Candidatus Endomicrobium trichonymphae]BAG13824.1 metallo-protease FtsH [Candidatus Endomicrobium trichonymphae]